MLGGTHFIEADIFDLCDGKLSVYGIAGRMDGY